MVREKGEDEEADRRREAAIASAAASLNPNFNPKSKGLTQDRLSKFQELHKRRLQIKAKSKVNKRGKGLGDGKGKTHKTALQAHDQEPNKPVGDSTTPIPENGVGLISSTDVAAKSAAKTRQKLHWGLDAKERWERKSNM